MSHSFVPPLDSHQLQVFVALAKTGSFTLAGRELRVSQSAVSHSIRVLEEATGCRLFDRLGKSAQPTPAGEQLLHHARRILDESDRARTALSHRQRWGKARLRLAISPFLAGDAFIRALRGFPRSMPGCPVKIELADEGRSVDLLLTDQVDVAFGVAPVGLAQIAVTPVWVDELRWITPADHPWAVADRVLREQIVGQTLILPGPSDGTRRLIDAYFLREGLPLTAHIEVSSPSVQLELIRSGAGIGIGDGTGEGRGAIGDGTGGGVRTFPLGRRKLRRTWGALRLQDHLPHLAEETFIRDLAACLVAAR